MYVYIYIYIYAIFRALYKQQFYLIFLPWLMLIYCMFTTICIKPAIQVTPCLSAEL